MKSRLFTLALVLGATACSAQTANLSDWKGLLMEKKDPKTAKSLCMSFTESKVLAEQVEAEKCLANVALFGADAVHLENDANGQPVMYDEYIPEAVDESLSHLNRGLQLAPQDLSIHQGRLHVLEIARRYPEMTKALDESCAIYHGKEVPDAWLAYSSELADLRQYDAGLEFMKVLDKHYPNKPDILGNIGAFLSYLKKEAEAIPYLQKAADIAPSDPINSWDLGRAYDYANQVELADKWYRKGLSLETDADQLKDSSCLYAVFVERKLHDRARACAMEKKDCSPEKQTACLAAQSSTKEGK